MSNYDNWLEAPYQAAAAASDAYVSWCEDEDLDPNDDHWDAFEQDMEDRAADAAIDAYESRMDAAYDD